MCLFRAVIYVVSEIIDWFGRDVTFSSETEETVDVRVRVNEDAMFYWAMQYGEYVEVLEPAALREMVRKVADAIFKMYL